MIRVRRPSNGPPILKRLGQKQTALDCAAYDRCPDDYHLGKEKFPKRFYFNDKEVKDLLMKVHHNKCCYCEMKLSTRAYLQVEHFRPKRGVRQTLGQTKDELPGYYWLAYCWKNLLLSCFDCNSTYKNTYFPLANPTKRVRSHHHDVAGERPLFVDPASQDPRRHIRFDLHTPIGKTTQGRMTVKGLGLRRPDFMEDKLHLLKLIHTHHRILGLTTNSENAELQAEARQFIESAKRPEAEFSSMVIDYVARLDM